MNENIKVKKCTIEDVSQLALLNKQLIDDEKSNNMMTILNVKIIFIDII